MNFKTAKTYAPELPLDPEHPRSVEVDGRGLASWSERQARGEVVLTAMDVLPRNGRYRLELRWPQNIF